MKKIVLFLTCILFLFPKAALAHIPGQPAFFKVDGVYSNFYHVPSTSLSDFNLPQDQTPATYLIGQDIDFEIDTGRLGIAADSQDKVKFAWDFGDGTKAQGRTTNHLYKKMGSYILTVHADDGQAPVPQLLESAIVNVVPTKDYKLPKAAFTANNIGSRDPLVDIVRLDLRQKVIFDSSQSILTSQATSYFWDFGDSKSATGKTQTHLYSLSQKMFFPVLRIIDKKGFIADAYLQINHSPSSQSPTMMSPSFHSTTTPGIRTVYLLAGVVVVLFIAIILFLGLRKRR